MKIFFTLLTILAIFQCIIAQEYTGKTAENIVQGSQAIRFNKQKSLSFIKLKDDYFISATGHKSWLADVLGMAGGYNISLTGQEPDNLGFIHYRYQVTYQNLPVDGYVYFVHTKDGKVISANGDFSKSNININVNNTISQTGALQKAKTYFNAEQYKWEFDNTFEQPEGNLVLVPISNSYSLAYKFDIYSVKPFRREYVYVSATDGKILKTVNRIHTANVAGSAATKYNGTRQIMADSYSGSYRLRENGNRGQGIETYDLNQSTSTGSAVDFTDSDNYWNTIANQDDAAYDAHFGAEATYDYLYSKFGRNSIDNMGFLLRSYVHYDMNYVNAFWDGQVMTYGDGDGYSYTALTSLDIVAHEITHGLTEFTANLEYSSESGALNESFSDIFGITIDFFNNPASGNWLIGDQISSTGDAFRNMSNPNQFQNPDTYQGLYWDPYEEVHCNSGVQNYWYYMICNGGTGVNDNGESFSVSGIGMDKAAQVAFRNLTVYLSQYSNYADARNYSIQAATDLFGACSDEVIAVTNAWHAVGVGSVFSNAVMADFSVAQTYFCTTPANVAFTNSSVNSTTYVWDFGDGAVATVANPAHTYTSPGTYSVRLITTGSASCGGTTDTMYKQNFITVSSAGGPVAAYCSPATVSTTGQNGIINFTLGSINKTSSGSIDGYEDYTCSGSTTVTEGKYYNFTFTSESSYGASKKIWIDANNDGQFNNTNELLYSNNTAVQFSSGSLLIPVVTAHNTPLRLRVASDATGTSYLATSCTNSQYGQIEDYSLVVLQNTDAPMANFSAANTTANLGQSVAFSDQSQNIPATWQWTFYGGTPSTSGLQNPTVVYNTLGTYNVRLVVTNAYGSDTLVKSAYISAVNSYNLCANTSTTSHTGTLYDSGGPTGSYQNSENCGFLIDLNCASSITLSFSSLQTESCCDYIRVYDGANSSGTQLLNASGSVTPAPVTAYSGKMYIIFTTDGSVISNGFTASWTAVVPSGTPPIGNFSIADTVAPLNWPVQFTDQSTNVPVGWNWNFGDGTTSSLQNPSHSFASSGTFNITLIVSNCFSADTMIKTIIVQNSPSITVSPSNINTTVTSCNDSVVVPLTVTNNGSGDLIYDITYGQGSSGANILFDNFEDGNYNGWTVGSGHTAAITTLDPANGSKCLSLSGYGSWNGLSQTFANATPSEISLHVKQTVTSPYNFIIIGDNNVQTNYGIIYAYFAGSYLYIYNGSSTVSTPFATNQWYHLEFKNINFSTKRFDVYINGSLFMANLGFRSSVPTYISKIHLFNSSSSVTAYYDDICIGSLPSFNSWVTAVPDSGLVSSGSSQTVNVTLNAQGMTSGVYTTQLSVTSNDIAHSPLTIPCTFTVAGAPVIALSDTCLNYGTIVEFTNKTDTLRIINSGCDTLRITNITSTAGEFTPSSFQMNIAPYDSGQMTVIFHPSSMGTYSGNLNIVSNAGNRTVCFTGVADGAPIIAVQPPAFNVNINSCNDSVTLPLSIINSGNGDLNFTVSGYGGIASGPTQVLAFTNGVDYTGEYTNTLAALNQYNSNYNLSETNTTSAAVLQTALTGKRVFLVAEQETQTNPTIFTNFAPVLQSFVNNGGTVIFCGVATSSSSCIFNTGLFSGTYSGSISSSTLNVVNTSHPITTGIPSGIPAQNITLYCSFTNSDKVTLVNYAGSFDVVTYRQIGAGKVIYIGYDYYAYDSNAAKIIANAVAWGGTGGGVSWLSVSDSLGIAAPGDTAHLSATFSSAGLLAGIYSSNLTINHNDPTHQPVSIPCTLTVNGLPLVSVSDTCLSFGTVVQFTNKSDSIYVGNSGCDTLHVTNITSGSASYSASPSNFTVPPGDSVKVVVTFAPASVGTISANLDIFNDDANVSVCLNGASTGAPQIVLDPSSYNVSITSCNDSVTYPLYIHNTGLSQLTWTYQQPVATVSDDFDPSIDYTVWQTVNGGTASNSCGSYSTPYSLYFDGSYREAITRPLNTLSGGNIGFYLKIASGSSPCETADSGEDIILSYSTNNGSTWTMIQTYYTGSYINFTQINIAIPAAARTSGTMFKWAQPYNSGFGYDNWSIDNVSISSSASASFAHLLTNTGSVTAGDSMLVYIRFSSQGLDAGTYTTQVLINSNDPLQPQVALPCTLTVTGIPELALSQSCLNFGTVMQYTQNKDTLYIYNNGCSTLVVSNIVSSSGEYTVNTTSATVPPNDTGMVIVTFTPQAAGASNGNIYIFNNDMDTVVCVSGIAQSAPDANITPASFDVTLNSCGASTTLPFTIGNTGGGYLTYTLGNGNSSGTVQILAYTNGADMAGEYANTLAAINQYFTNYSITQTTTTSASTLQAALTGKQIFLVPELETISNPSVFTAFVSTLQSFIGNGGTVIFCGGNSTQASCIFNSGLFSGTFMGTTTGGTLSVLNTSHPVTNGLAASIAAQNATCYMDITNSDKTELVSYSTYDVVAFRTIGSGKAIYIGFDYYSYDANAARMIAQAVQWGGSATASWISFSATSGTVTPGGSQTVNITFDSNGMNGGTYISSFSFNSNDPVNPSINIPCTLHVAYNPCGAFGYAVSSCNGAVAFTDSTTNSPTSWQWNFGDGSTSSLHNPSHTYTSTGSFSVTLVACNGYGCDTVTRTVVISSLSGPVTASCTPTTTGNCCGMGIINVTFNTINNTTGDGSTGYQNYSCTNTTNVIVSHTYSLLVQTGSSYTENVGAWIDYNNNGSFETGEKVLTSSNAYSHSATFSIPSTATFNTPLRLRIGSDYYSNVAPNGCANVTYGQYEDYSVVVQPDNQPPVANFLVNVLDDCQGIVQFMNQSQNNPTSVLWDFGDGSTSTSLNPYHVYSTAGNYTVTLTATNAFGSDTYSGAVAIHSVTASFTADSILVEGSIVYFYSTTTGATSYNWNFGDGYSASVQNPVHVYLSQGTYNVTLSVSNSFGCSASSTQGVYIDYPLFISRPQNHNNISVYPNPSDGKVNIKIISSDEEVLHWKIVNNIGETILHGEIYKVNMKSVATVNLEGLASGVYYISFTGKKGQRVMKLFIR